VLADYVGLQEVLQSEAACLGWRKLCQSEKWVKRCILSGRLRADERRGLWPRLAVVSTLQDRWRRQLEASGADPGLDASRGCFKVLATQPMAQTKISEIERDVNRTFPTHPRFCQGTEGAGGREQLFQVLRATAAAVPAVGYCQGMNFVAAVLLLSVQEPHEAFWMMLAILDHYHFRHVFAPGVPLLPLRIFQFSRLVKERLPRLWRHLQEESSCVSIFAHQCVMTIFGYSIEPSFLVYVWDAVFFLGWNGVFRIGLGLLASLEERLLGMDAEDISRLLNSKKLFEPGAAGSSPSIQSGLRSLLRFKVSDESLLELQYAFKLQRWEELVAHAAGDQPLPLGLERSACGKGVKWDLHACSTENRPPWRTDAPDVAVGMDEDNGNSIVFVSFECVKLSQGKLREFDAQTQRDVAALSVRIGDAEKELAVILKETQSLRAEVEQTTLEQEERQDIKQALIETLQVAVKSSANSPVSKAPGADETVHVCLRKMKQAENEYFEQSQRLTKKLQELDPFQAQIDDRQEYKQRAMAQLSAFLEFRQTERSDLMNEWLRTALAGNPETAALAG